MMKRICVFVIVVVLMVVTIALRVGRTFADLVPFVVKANDYTLEMSVSSDSVVLDLDSSSEGVFGSEDLDISVGTNSQYGYTLKMSTDPALNGGLKRTKALGDGSGVYPTIPAIPYVSGGYTQAQIEASSALTNTWGYKCTACTKNGVSANTNYIPMPTISADIASTNAAGNANTTTVTFGAKIDNETPAGVYGTTIVFAAIVNNPGTISSISQLEYMQQFATLTSSEKTDVVNSMIQDRQYSLKDNRDEKEYYIAKLADGNIWMTQNLDLDLSSSTTYTPNDTDISANWTPSASTYTTDNTTTWNKSKTILESYDPGDRCWNSEEITTTGTSLNDGTTTCDDDNKYYNRHFHIGNYYNWTAIVAMNDSSAYNTIDTDVDQSICPAGWMLPKSNATITTSGSFRYFRDRLTLVSGPVNMGGNVSQSPVYLAYSGGWVGNGAWGIGSSGYYWSSVVDSADYVYSLYIGGDEHLSVKSQSGRDSGLSARCVLRLERNSIEDIAYMQDFSGLTSTEKASVLSSMTTNVQYQLRDSRDEKTYYISKLEDGNVWMTQNLDLDLKRTNYGGNGWRARFNPNSGNTDLNEYATSGYTDGYVCTGTKADCSNGIIAWVPENSTIDGPSNLNSTNWVNDVNNPYSYDPGAGDSVDPSGSADGHRLTGNYYNWTAAIASNNSSGRSSKTYNDTSNNPNNSICPKGWRLPTISNQSGNIAGSTNEFARLNALYNGGSESGVSNLVNTPLYLARSGSISGGALKGAGAYGDYWSSTVSSGDYAYFLYFTTESGQDFINTANSLDRRYRGYSVRCIVR